MVKILSRVGLVAAAVSVFPGCLEYALIEALKEDAPDEAYPESPYYEDEPYYDDTYQEEQYVEEDIPTEYDDSYTNPNALDVRSASLAGDMGQVRGFADEQPLVNAYDYGTYSSIDVTAAAPNGSAMAILQIQGSLDDPQLVDGAHLEFQGYGYSETELYMYLVGCSGPTQGNWVFDEGAETLVVDVSITPEGTTVLDFGATFTDGQTVVGSTELGALQAQ